MSDPVIKKLQLNVAVIVIGALFFIMVRYWAEAAFSICNINHKDNHGEKFSRRTCLFSSLFISLLIIFIIILILEYYQFKI